jgi:putative aldouronate transport system substrate-binding protein
MFAPETKHALEFMNKAFRNGYFDPNQFTMDNSGVQAAILSGRVFAFIGNVANTKFDDVSSNNTWVSPGPILSNQNTKPVWGKYQKTGTGWMQTYISKTASNPERIAQFIDFMESDEGQMLWNFGFEGKDYTLENGLVHKTEQGVKDAGDWTKTGVGAFWEFANLAWNDHVTPAPTAETNPKALMAIKVHTAAGKASVMYDTSALAMPSDFFPAGSKEANDQVQIATYTEAQVTKVILSKNDDAFNQSYNDMINQLKQLGLTEIDAKINEQFHKQEQAMGESIKGVNS